jgi:hypothetical protein
VDDFSMATGYVSDQDVARAIARLKRHMNCIPKELGGAARTIIKGHEQRWGRGDTSYFNEDLASGGVPEAQLKLFR